MKNNKIVIIASVIIVIALVILTVAGSYAFYTSTLTPKGDSGIGATAANLKLEFTDGDKEIDVNNLIPGESVTKTFSVLNSGSVTVKFRIVINNVSNNFEKQDDVEISLQENDGTPKKIKFPTETTPLSDTITINSQETKNFTVIVTYKETNDPEQIHDMGKTVSGKIFIEPVA